MEKKIILAFIIFLISIYVNAQTRQPLNPSDIYRQQDVSSVEVSPDGKWVAYVVSTVDTAKDDRNNDIWMVSWDGKENVQLTNSPEDESSPKWSPDGKYLSFLSSRKSGKEDEEEDDNDDKELNQLWLLDRRGGEGKKITDVKGEIEDYSWKPDGKKVLLVIKDQDFSDTAKSNIRVPYVMDRYHFKEDYIGYLDHRAIHLYLLDIALQNVDTLTTGKYDEISPSWSPDGTQITFASNRTADPDKNENTDIYIMDAKPGTSMKKLTTWAGHDDMPQWSPDGKSIAYLQSSSNENFTMYGEDILAVISKDGGPPKLLSKPLDRPVTNLRWNKDGNSIAALMEDDRQSNVVAFDVNTGAMSKIGSGDRMFAELQLNPANGNWATLMGEPQLPFEVFVLENGNTRRLTYVQDSFLAPLQLASVEGFKSKSKDGTIVSGLLYKPVNAVAGQKLPLVMYIHGGPTSQDDYEFDFIAQTVACAGYAVAQINYRGSTGRGDDFTRAIYGDWGNKEVADILGAIDYLVSQGIADSNRIGIFGWSYGGILTDYSIASDTRFKAACSGAGSALQLSMYGVDEYITQYENELGPPWKNTDKWMKLSYPFFKADKIKTPTLFMACQNDFNVPSVGAEQMYQALRSLGVPTKLIIYPNQNHGISIPSYQKFRYDQQIEWFNTYMK